MKIIRWLTVTVLLGSLTIQAAPIITVNWDEPTTYLNGQPIDPADIVTYTLFCNDTSGEQGPPYEVAIALDDPGAPPSVEDLVGVVNGQAGTYWCAARASSSLYPDDSGFSVEANFTVTSGDLGFVLSPPTNLTLQ